MLWLHLSLCCASLLPKWPPQGPTRLSLSHIAFYLNESVSECSVNELENVKIQQVARVGRQGPNGVRLKELDGVIYDRFFFKVKPVLDDEWERMQKIKRKSAKEGDDLSDFTIIPSPSSTSTSSEGSGGWSSLFGAIPTLSSIANAIAPSTPRPPKEMQPSTTQEHPAMDKPVQLAGWEKEFPDLFPYIRDQITVQREYSPAEHLDIRVPRLREDGSPREPRPVRFEYEMILDMGTQVWIQDSKTGQYHIYHNGDSTPSKYLLSDLTENSILMVIIPVEMDSGAFRELPLPSVDPSRRELPRWNTIQDAHAWARKYRSPKRIIMCAQVKSTVAPCTSFAHWRRGYSGKMGPLLISTDTRRDVMNREIKLLDPRNLNGKAMAETGEDSGKIDPWSIFYGRSAARLCVQHDGYWGFFEGHHFYPCCKVKD